MTPGVDHGRSRDAGRTTGRKATPGLWPFKRTHKDYGTIADSMSPNNILWPVLAALLVAAPAAAACTSTTTVDNPPPVTVVVNNPPNIVVNNPPNVVVNNPPATVVVTSK